MYSMRWLMITAVLFFVTQSFEVRKNLYRNTLNGFKPLTALTTAFVTKNKRAASAVKIRSYQLYSCDGRSMKTKY